MDISPQDLPPTSYHRWQGSKHRRHHRWTPLCRTFHQRSIIVDKVPKHRRHLSAGPLANIVSSSARFLSIEDFFFDQDNDDELLFDINNENNPTARSSTNVVSSLVGSEPSLTSSAALELKFIFIHSPYAIRVD